MEVIKPLLKKPLLNPVVSANYRPISNLPFISTFFERVNVIWSSAELASNSGDPQTHHTWFLLPLDRSLPPLVSIICSGDCCHDRPQLCTAVSAFNTSHSGSISLFSIIKLCWWCDSKISWGFCQTLSMYPHSMFGYTRPIHHAPHGVCYGQTVISTEVQQTTWRFRFSSTLPEMSP